jgi:putative flippase GtrA
VSARAAQPLKFLLVGAGGYVVNLLAFSGLYAVGVSYLAASLIAYFQANLLMYLGNRYFTFRLSHDGFWAAYVRYVLVGGAVAGLNAALLAVFVEGAVLDPRLGQALSLLALTSVAFMLNKRWTFQLRPA